MGYELWFDIASHRFASSLRLSLSHNHLSVALLLQIVFAGGKMRLLLPQGNKKSTFPSIHSSFQTVKVVKNTYEFGF